MSHWIKGIFTRLNLPEKSARIGRTWRVGSLAAMVLVMLFFSAVLASGGGTNTTLVTRTCPVGAAVGDPGCLSDPLYPNKPYGDGVSEYASTSDDGRFAVFASRSLILQDAHSLRSEASYYDVYLFDRDYQTVENEDPPKGKRFLISRAYGSLSSANGDSRFPIISRDGRYIVFQSSADNLIPSPNSQGGDTNGKVDIFIYDVSCISETQNGNDTYIYDTYFKEEQGYTTGCLEGGGLAYQSIAKVSTPEGSMGTDQANDDSGNSSQDPYPRMAIYLSGTFKYPFVLFESSASNLVAGDTNGVKDIFVRDVHGTRPPPNPGAHTYCLTCKVPGSTSLTNGASSNPVVSTDGKWISFVSSATNLVSGTGGRKNVYLLNTDQENHFANPTSLNLISKSSSGVPGNGNSTYPSMKSDGTSVAFQSMATNLDSRFASPNYTHIYQWTSPNQLEGISAKYIAESGSTIIANNNSYNPHISANGNAVAFTSFADNLVEGDTNMYCLQLIGGHYIDANCPDVFVRDSFSKEVWRVSLTKDGLQGQEKSGLAYLSDDARYIYFVSYARLEDTGENAGSVQQIFFRNQGSPPGNPNIQPTYWVFYGYPWRSNQLHAGTTHRFTLRFLGDGSNTVYISGDSSIISCQDKVKNQVCVVPEPPLPTAIPFTIVRDTCTTHTFSGGESCYLDIKYLPIDEGDHHTALVSIPLGGGDLRGSLTIGLEGYGKIMVFMPLVVQEGF